MKKMFVFSMVLCCVSITLAGFPASNLFSDSFDRPDSTDIDSATTGMSGTLSPLNYDEVFEGSGAASSIQVKSNELNIAVGAGMSSLYLDHNFTNAAILTDGGFSVSLDVVSITSAGDPANRFGGFGVGNTLAEAQAAEDSFDSAVPFRPNTARANQGIGVSDFYVDLALDQNLRLWSNGVLLNTINVSAASGTIRVDFFVTDFNAGSNVDAIVYFNGAYQDIQSFAWDNTGANYLGISGRTAGNGVFLDNLSIQTVYNDRANNPVPGNGTKDVVPGLQTLQWNKGLDATGNPNADITKHYLYVTEIVNNSEPNFLNPNSIYTAEEVDASTNPASRTFTLSFDQVIYWRVDESVLVGGNPSGPNDPNTLTGFVWTFDAQRSVPIITSEGQPQDILRFPSTSPDYEGDAVFTCVFESVSSATVEWYRAADPNNPIDDVDTDITINTVQNGSDYTSILTIANVEVADAGSYYCIIENATGPAMAVTSDTADLGVKRLVGYWPLNGNYLDLSGEGHDADPNLAPNPVQWINGVDPAETGLALDLNPKPLSAADTGDWVVAEFTGEFTVSAWVKWAGPGGWQGILSNRQPGAGWNFFVEIRADNGNVQLGGNAFGTAMQSEALPIGEWTHVAVTNGSNGSVIYFNGEIKASKTAVWSTYQDIAGVYFGCLQRDNGVLANPFNGVIDDVQVYNYGMSYTEVADIYYDILETAVCVNPNGVGLDFDVAGGPPDGQGNPTGDCKVNLIDFAEFASDWLNCGLYPQFECN